MTNFQARIAFPVWVFKLSRDSKGFEGTESLALLCSLFSSLSQSPSANPALEQTSAECTEKHRPRQTHFLESLGVQHSRSWIRTAVFVASFISCALASVLSHHQGNHVGVHPNCLPTAFHVFDCKMPPVHVTITSHLDGYTVSLLSCPLPPCCLINPWANVENLC